MHRIKVYNYSAINDQNASSASFVRFLVIVLFVFAMSVNNNNNDDSYYNTLQVALPPLCHTGCSRTNTLCSISTPVHITNVPPLQPSCVFILDDVFPH